MGQALVEAAGLYGTPCYLTDLGELDRGAEQLRSAFPDPWIRQYSLKANPLPAIVARLAAHGIGANVVSLGEWEAAKAAHLSNDQITFEGIGKTDQELRAAVAAAAAGEPLRWLTVESADEARVLCSLADEAGLAQRGASLELLLRLNPAVEPETQAGLKVGAEASKFGMSEQVLKELTAWIDRADLGVVVRGVHVHVGSHLEATGSWTKAALGACRLVHQLAEHDPAIDTVDLGGGFAEAHALGPALSQFRQDLDRALEQAQIALPARAAVEPGRFLVASAGWLVAQVLHVRERPGRSQVVIDASFSELIRPVLYGARHPVLPLRWASSVPQSAWREALVEGALCESTDTFGVHRLPPLARGDLVVLATTGAYGASMFSHYNGRPRPPEVLLSPAGELSLARAARPFSPS